MSREVVLIGNGPLSRQLPPEVVAKAFVIRFNVPRRHPPEFGERCDALCVTNHGNPGRHIAKFRSLLGNKYITPGTEIWIPRPRFRSAWSCMYNHPIRKVRWTLDHAEHIICRNKLRLNTTVLFSEQLWCEAFDALGLDKSQMQVSPSSGFLALVYVLKRFPPDLYRIHLSGFTFEGSAAHPWAMEKAAAGKLANAGKIKIWETATPKAPHPSTVSLAMG
jgi:hypothetical protein